MKGGEILKQALMPQIYMRIHERQQKHMKPHETLRNYIEDINTASNNIRCIEVDENAQNIIKDFVSDKPYVHRENIVKHMRLHGYTLKESKEQIIASYNNGTLNALSWCLNDFHGFSYISSFRP